MKILISNNHLKVPGGTETCAKNRRKRKKQKRNKRKYK